MTLGMSCVLQLHTLHRRALLAFHNRPSRRHQQQQHTHTTNNASNDCSSIGFGFRRGERDGPRFGGGRAKHFGPARFKSAPKSCCVVVCSKYYACSHIAAESIASSRYFYEDHCSSGCRNDTNQDACRFNASHKNDC